MPRNDVIFIQDTDRLIDLRRRERIEVTPDQSKNPDPCPSPDAPYSAHYWVIGMQPEQIGACHYCKEVRSWGRVSEARTKEELELGAAAKSNGAARSTRSSNTLKGMEIDEEVLIDHQDVSCVLYDTGGVLKCTLQTTANKMRHTHARSWRIVHHQAHLATVTRIR